MERACRTMANEPASVAYARLVRLNELITDLWMLHESVPGAGDVHNSVTAEPLRAALEDVRRIVAHAVAISLKTPARK